MIFLKEMFMLKTSFLEKTSMNTRIDGYGSKGSSEDVIRSALGNT